MPTAAVPNRKNSLPVLEGAKAKARPFGLPIRVLIADNNQMNSELLAVALRRCRPIQLAGCATDYASLRDAVASAKPHVLLISPDLEDGTGTGFRILREFRMAQIPTKVVVLLDSARKERVLEAFWCGAQGVFSKSGSIKTLCKCIISVHSGQVWANSEQMKQVLEALTYSSPPRLVDAKGVDLLTQREQEVVRCLAEGLSNREVAQRLQLSQHTVKNYLLHIFDKLGVSSRVEVVLYASGQNPPERNIQNPEAIDDIPAEDSDLLTSYRQAARQGYPVSQFRLATILRDGRGCPPDPVSAYVWYELARSTSEKLSEKSREARDELAAEKLTPEQLSEAHGRISGWLRLFD
jgi:DNA-binding NarL/FixJ family response regulator